MTDSAREGCVHVRRARESDRAVIESLLAEAQLPLAGVGEWVEQFWVAEAPGEEHPVGVSGVEVYGDVALLRSVAVAPHWRGAGIARLLSEQALRAARDGGVREVYLLTTTAEPYFARLGFACVTRDTAPAPLQQSAEFQGACPASAVLMHRALGST